RVDEMELRPAYEHQGERVSPCQTERGKARGERADALGVLLPRDRHLTASRSQRVRFGVSRCGELEQLANGGRRVHRFYERRRASNMACIVVVRCTWTASSFGNEAGSTGEPTCWRILTGNGSARGQRPPT